MGPFNASCSTCGGTVEAQQGSVFALCLPGEVVRSQHLRSSISALDNLLQHLVRLKMSLREVLLLLNQVFYRCSHFSVCFFFPHSLRKKPNERPAYTELMVSILFPACPETLFRLICFDSNEFVPCLCAAATSVFHPSRLQRDRRGQFRQGHPGWLMSRPPPSRVGGDLSAKKKKTTTHQWPTFLKFKKYKKKRKEREIFFFKKKALTGMTDSCTHTHTVGGVS